MTENRKKTGLVMEGGAMRGMFTAGVLDVIMEEGLDRAFDGAIGVSAGATFGCNIKSHQIGRTVRYNTKYCGDWRYVSWRSLFTTGDLYGAEFCYETVPYELDPFDVETFNQSPMKFYCVCTDAETGKPFYHYIPHFTRKDMEYVRASASMPIFARPVEIDGRIFLDGGTSDPIPVTYFEHKGYEKIVVLLTQPADYVKQKAGYLPAARILLRKYPALIRDLEDRHIRYNQRTAYIRRKEEAGEIFVIRPPMALNIGSMEKDPAELRRVYGIGRKTMEEGLDALKAYLDRE
jgi:predicted patatin/cPLA2 family phospholipase